jgi:hypothetical protein
MCPTGLREKLLEMAELWRELADEAAKNKANAAIKRRKFTIEQTFKSAGHLGSACVGLSSGREHRSAISASFKMVRCAAGFLSFFAISR